MSAPATIRIFVSSTFRDMHAERDLLNRIVFPELTARCARRGADLIGYDLRLGVPREEAETVGALSICLDAISRCRPFFLAFIGERYGWVPAPDSVPLEVYERAAASPQAPRALERYALDASAAPPVHALRRDRPPSDAEADELNTAFARAGLPLAGESITAREVLTALAGGDRGSAWRALFYLRRPGLAAHPNLPTSWREVFGESAPDRRERLERLRERIRSGPGAAQVRDYELVPAGAGQDGAPRFDGLDALAERLIEDLWRGIEEELAAAGEQPAARPAAEAYQDRFRRARASRLAGRDELLDRLLDAAASDERKPLAVAGAAGAGKSAVLAAFAERCRARWPDALVADFFIGASPGSTAAGAVARALAGPLARSLTPAPALPEDDGDLILLLPELLARAAAARRVILVVDALDQLDAEPDGRELAWLPAPPPPGSALVLSTLAPAGLARLRERLPDAVLTLVPPLAAAGSRALVSAHLAERGKMLSPRQLDRLLDAAARPDAGLPLFLRVALDELCLFGDFAALDERIERLGPGLGDLLDQLLARLEADHGAELTRAACSALAVARAGLAEGELLELLSPEGGGLARLRWMRLRRGMESLLSPADEEAPEGLIDFHHEELRVAARRRYFGMAGRGAAPTPAWRDAHARLAAFFRAKARTADGAGWRGERDRPLAELVFHLRAAGADEELAATLTDLGFIRARAEAGGLGGLQRELARTAGRLGEIADFVAAHAHLLAQAPSATAGLAFHHAADGPLAGAAAAALARSREPWLATAGSAGVRTPSPARRTLQGHRDAVIAAALSADGALAATLSRDGTGRLWELATGQTLARLRRPSGALTAVALSSDGRRALTGGAGGELCLWDAASGRALWAVPAHSLPVGAVAFADGERIALSAVGHAPGDLSGAEHDTRVRLWEPATGRPAGALPAMTARCLPVTPDGRLAAVRGGSYDGKGWRNWLDIVALDGGRLVSRLLEPGVIELFALSADGATAVAVDPGGALSVRRVGSAGAALAPGEGSRRLREGRAPASALALATDGRRLLLGRSDGALELWDLAAGEQVALLTGHGGAVEALALTPDARLALSASRDHTARVWDLAAAQGTPPAQASAKGPSPPQAPSVLPSPERAAPCLAASRDGRVLAAASRHPAIRLIDPATGAVRAELAGHALAPTALLGSPIDDLLVSGSADGGLRVWSFTEARCLAALDGHAGPIVGLGLVGGGRLLCSTGKDGTVRLWRLPGGPCVSVWTAREPLAGGPAPEPGALAFRAAGGRRHRLELRNAEGGLMSPAPPVCARCGAELDAAEPPLRCRCGWTLELAPWFAPFDPATMIYVWGAKADAHGTLRCPACGSAEAEYETWYGKPPSCKCACGWRWEEKAS